MTIEDLRGKKIGILGFGVEGNAVASFLRAHNLDFAVYDQKDGAGYLSEIGSREIIFRSPGVRLDLPELRAAQSAGAIITSQTKFFFDNCEAKIVGITGTKGKSTAAKLIYEILQRAEVKSFLAGNYGEPMLNLLDEAGKDSIVVLELSSFQLQDLEKSPHLAVVLMVTSEHLNYHSDEKEYVQAKSALTRFQSKDDFAVVNYDYPNSMEIGKLGSATKLYVQTVGAQTANSADPFQVFKASEYLKIKNGFFAENVQHEAYFVEEGELREFMPLSEVPLRGFHNIQNVGAAALAAKILNIETEIIKDAVSSFKPLPHRLELVGDRDGVKFFDDSISTTPESCVASVQAFSEPVILIIGGDDKKSDYKALAQELAGLRQLKAVVCIGEIGPSLKDALQKASFRGEVVTGRSDMGEIVGQAKELAVAGDVVLLAPATSSFGMFKDYKDRGEQFKQNI